MKQPELFDDFPSKVDSSRLPTEPVRSAQQKRTVGRTRSGETDSGAPTTSGPDSTAIARGKRKKPVLLTARTKKLLQREGYIVALVERSINVPAFKQSAENPGFRNKFDAFGIADQIACHPQKTGTLFLQVTDLAHAAEHRDKILQSPNTLVILQANNRIQLHTWKAHKKKGRKMWQFRVEHFYLSTDGSNVIHEIADRDRWFFDAGFKEMETF